MNEQLPQYVIEEDHLLEQGEKRASDALIKHRWFWTLNEDNPQAITVAAYARLVGRSSATISQYAKAYEVAHEAERSGSSMSVDEAKWRAKTSVEQQVATDAVAKARGVGHRTAGRADGIYADETRQVLKAAREAAERKGTSVEEEAPRIAELIVKVEQANQRNQDEDREAIGFRFIELHGYLTNALRFMAKASKLAGQLEWPPEEQEILREAGDKVRLAVEDVQARIAGATRVYVDWDAVASEAEAKISE